VRNWCGARFGRGAVASGRFWLITYAKSLVDVIAKWGNQVRLEWSKLVRPALPVGAEKDPLVPNDIDVHSRSRQGKIESNIIANNVRESTGNRSAVRLCRRGRAKGLTRSMGLKYPAVSLHLR
jgi:hypothetical protein